MAEERVVTSLPEQLKAAYAKGTTASKSLKTFAGKALPVSYWVVGILFLIGMILIFIPYVREEARKPPVAPVAQTQAPQPTKTVEVVAFGPGCTEPRKTYSNQCLRWDEKSPDQNTLRDFIVPEDGDDWIPWKEYRKRYAGAGRAAQFRYLKHCSEVPTEVHYTVRPKEGPRDTCY